MIDGMYFRLLKDGHFVGFKRVVVEYLPAGSDKWLLNSIIEHDPEETQRLSKPGVGIASLKRESIGAYEKHKFAEQDRATPEETTRAAQRG